MSVPFPESHNAHVRLKAAYVCCRGLGCRRCNVLRLSAERPYGRVLGCHGHADGEIQIINEQPHFTGGVRKVVDNVHTGREEIKETAEIEKRE